MKLETYLSYAPLFKGIATADIIKLMKCVMDKPIEFRKGNSIVMTGETQSGIGLLVHGQAYTFARERNGRNKFVAMINTGECFGLENVFRFRFEEDNNKACWFYSVVAAKDCQIAFLDIGRVINPCAQNCPCHQILTKNLISAISSSLYGQSRRSELLTIKNMRGRIAVYLLQCIEDGNEDPTMISLPFNRNRMAAYLDVSRPSMSREMASMKNDGILDYYLDTIQILDMERLKTLAEKSSR